MVRSEEIALIEQTIPYNSPDCLHNVLLRKEGIGWTELFKHNLDSMGCSFEHVVIKTVPWPTGDQ